MSRSLAEESISSIDDLSHAVAGVAHVEKPFEEGRVTIRKLKILRQPVEKEVKEANAKLYVLFYCLLLLVFNGGTFD